MTAWALIRRSLSFYRRRHAGLLVGAALSCAVLTGALLVGDSVRYSLRRFALMRLGRAAVALQSPNRFVAESLGDRLQEELGSSVSPVLQLHGVAVRGIEGMGSKEVAQRIRVLGVDNRFWNFGSGAAAPLGANDVAISRNLADALHVGPGDEISVRIERPSMMPRDAPLSDPRQRARRMRGRIVWVVADDQLGRFSLEATQVAPFNVFVPLGRVQDLSGLTGRVNTLLVAAAAGRPLAPEQANRALRDVWRIDDIGLRLRTYGEIVGAGGTAPSLGNNREPSIEVGRVGFHPDRPHTMSSHVSTDYGADAVALESDRIFLDPEVAESALGLPGAQGSLSYLVNSITADRPDGKTTPYSFVTALSPSPAGRSGVIPERMSDDEIVVNRWLAEALSVTNGDSVRLRYFVLTPSSTFEETGRLFRVSSVVGMERLRREQDLMPSFPGLTDVEQCSDWSIGLPLDEARLSDKSNEEYWNRWRQTPKGFVTLRAGQAMWANRFGGLTGARYPSAAGGLDAVRGELRRRIDPAEVGLAFLPVRRQALDAAGASTDFGQLFVAMSFFLILSAVLLTGLLFDLALRARGGEMGILLAAGFRAEQARRLYLAEGAIVALAGSAIGVLPGVLYTRGLLWGLRSYWQGAVAGAAIDFHAEPGSMLLGAAIAFAAALAAVEWGTRRLARRTAVELLRGEAAPDDGGPEVSRRATMWRTTAIVCGAGAAAMVAMPSFKGGEGAVPAFFGGGALLLGCGLSAAAWLLRERRLGAERGLTLAGLQFRNLRRQRGRSLTAVAVLSCGVFLVLSVSSMQEGPAGDAGARSSGTGGFGLIGESAFPLSVRLDSETELEKLFPADGSTPGLRPRFVPIKVRQGEEANCLNLNRVLAPRLLGISPSAMSERRAFLPKAGVNVWDLLAAPLPDGSIPGLAGDLNTAMWGIRKRVGPDRGESLLYADERGRPFRVKLVGALPVRVSVLQGNVIMPDWAFTQLFPSEGGHRMFLADACGGAEDRWRRDLSAAFERDGLDVTPCADRLREFSGVETTYLAMFLVLGGLGLALGTVGIGVVLAWNVAERRVELAILRAVGYREGMIRRLVLGEHLALLAAGLTCGTISAWVAAWPNWHAAQMGTPWRQALGMLLAMAVVGVFSTLAAVRVSLRADPIRSLRNE